MRKDKGENSRLLLSIYESSDCGEIEKNRNFASDKESKNGNDIFDWGMGLGMFRKDDHSGIYPGGKGSRHNL